MSERKTKVELVTPVYNRRETTLQALRSLRRIDITGLDVHIIVVDDGSTDGTSDAVREQFPEVQIVEGDGTLHYAAGTNRGFTAALERKPDYIVAMNDDTIFHDQFLRRLVACAEANPRSIVGALLLLWDEPHKVFQVAPEWSLWRGGWELPQEKAIWDFPAEAFEVHGMAGNCLIYPAQAIKEVGLMDEKRFPHGWGDLQYTRKMKNAGWRLLVEPKSLVWCEPNTYPPPLHSVSLSKALKNLLVNQRHPLNLNRQFTARWESAPSKPQALFAFGVYLAQLGGKIIEHSLFKRYNKRAENF